MFNHLPNPLTNTKPCFPRYNNIQAVMLSWFSYSSHYQLVILACHLTLVFWRGQQTLRSSLDDDGQLMLQTGLWSVLSWKRVAVTYIHPVSARAVWTMAGWPTAISSSSSTVWDCPPLWGDNFPRITQQFHTVDSKVFQGMIQGRSMGFCTNAQVQRFVLLKILFKIIKKRISYPNTKFQISYIIGLLSFRE